MGWWELASGEEIGDQAADIVADALDRLRHEGPAAGLGPTPSQFVQALADALASRQAGRGLRAVLRDGDNCEAEGRCDPPDGIAARIASLLDALEDCYLTHLARPARTSELCAVIAFVLRPDPTRYLAEAENWRLRRLEPLVS